MGRGFGALAKPTGKCNCDNPKWKNVVDGVSWIDNGVRLRYSLRCFNCGKWWYTKSRSARQYFDVNEKFGNGDKSYGELFAEADNSEKQYFDKVLKIAEENAMKANKELDSVRKSYDKFMRDLNAGM